MSFFKSIKGALGLEIERPPYQVLKAIGPNAEIRKYNASKWVGASVTGHPRDYNSNYQGSMFNQLFKYISGDNDARQKIAMTSPVTVDYKCFDGALINENSNVQMSMRFYVPEDKQSITPNPNATNMFVESDPEMIVAVIKFGGYASMSDYLKHRDELIGMLGADAKNYDLVNMMTAGYDPPFKPINRTNEVWLRKMN